MTAPIAATEEWQAVMDRAGHQCQCARAGHRGHRVAGRCLTRDDEAGARLIAAPANPGPYPARTMARTPVDELVAWCPPCFDHAVKAARTNDKAIRSRQHEPGLW